MDAKKLNWKNILWIIIEILISTFNYYLIQWTLENRIFPLPDDMMLAVFILLLLLGIIYSITVFVFIKVDEFITKETLNYKKGILYLILGAAFSLIVMNLLYGLNVIDSDFPLLLFILIVMTIPVLCLNCGLRINRIEKNNA